MIAGNDAATHGEAKNSWLTGTAAWNFVAISQYLLGVRPDFDGLRVDPVLPASWPGFTATRRFRGADYRDHRPPVWHPRVRAGRRRGRPRQRPPDRRHPAPLAPPGETVTVEMVLPST